MVSATLGIAPLNRRELTPGIPPALNAPPVPAAEVESKLDGIATWYGAGLQGHETAEGERFDMNRFTAAHRKLPFGSIVRVTNLQNGRSVVVRINDRGPLPSDRMIDLSRAAARRVGMIGAGVARVHIDVIRLGSAT